MYKKSYWGSKMHPSCLTPLVLLIFNLPCQIWGVITFEQFISLCWNFQDNLISYIPLIWKSIIKIWDESCPALVHLTWNDPKLFFGVTLYYLWIPCWVQLYYHHFVKTSLYWKTFHCSIREKDSSWQKLTISNPFSKTSQQKTI